MDKRADIAIVEFPLCGGAGGTEFEVYSDSNRILFGWTDREWAFAHYEDLCGQYWDVPIPRRILYVLEETGDWQAFEKEICAFALLDGEGIRPDGNYTFAEWQGIAELEREHRNIA